ncbi:CheY chemotaxis protein or a CheY-like REC (receiver) domain [Cnuella takakiae]|uniref:CheY chemotaxis protein or a CheY-like REC (Receiver) domain n=1 Tax=Cnuella takakiae TaxID=1302690 RepID=A0A1M4VVP5_9BACT|nr:response regulator [Cnuella takakiae]OLY92486.1 hypothetical protein BUE76_11755 [Cnuella takakiae]SHE72943.1 CheY chemotaxis protein or a CheY-like REC (receiver) domain [Cnuella takakiae]
MDNGLPFSVLMVEDDEDDRAIIDEAFLDLHFAQEVKKFKGGKMLLDYLSKIEPNLYPSLIILDSSIPGMDGLQILKLLKENPNYNQIPVLIVSTFISPAKQSEFVAAGAYGCIQKGNNYDEVIRMAEKIKNISQSNVPRL